MYNSKTLYKPVVPKWVAEILERERNQDVFASHGRTKAWDKWKRSYSRKFKYAKLNGWIVGED